MFIFIHSFLFFILSEYIFFVHELTKVCYLEMSYNTAKICHKNNKKTITVYINLNVLLPFLLGLLVPAI